MDDFFDRLFRPGSKGLRRQAEVHLTVDADGKPVLAPVSGEAIVLSSEGAIDTITLVVPDRVYHCGCTVNIPFGGKCGVPGCGRLSCQKCFAHCLSCKMPLCLEHTRVLQNGADDVQPQAEVHLCVNCYSQITRKKMFRAAVRALLGPFVEWEANPKR